MSLRRLMKKIYLFVTTLLLSYSVLAISQVYVINDNTPLKADNNSNAKTLVSLAKNTELSRLTMHYSGWSQVSTNNNLVGWISSDQLSTIAPAKSIKPALISDTALTDMKKVISDLKLQLDIYKKDNQKLLSNEAQLQDKFDLSTNQFTQQIELLNQDKQRLKATNNDLSIELESLTFDRNLLIAIVLLIGVLIGFIISAIFNKIAKNKRDSFNTIRRSY